MVFLLGSALCALSQNMNELIAFRAVQGLGAGGLMTLALTIIADIVSPRERGRYQGLLGAVWAFASIAGPLIGGFFVGQPVLALGVHHQRADRRSWPGRHLQHVLQLTR